MLSSLCGSSFLFMEDCYMCLKPDLFANLADLTGCMYISDLQSLQVTIEILYPQTDEDTFYRITTWQVLNVDELQ